MATYPTIAEVKRLANKHGCQKTITFFVGVDGKVGFTSYGVTRQLCQEARDTGDEMWGAFVESCGRAAGARTYS